VPSPRRPLARGGIVRPRRTPQPGRQASWPSSRPPPPRWRDADRPQLLAVLREGVSPASATSPAGGLPPCATVWGRIHFCAPQPHRTPPPPCPYRLQ